MNTTRQDRAIIAAKAMATFANDINRDAAAFTAHMMREHRTIQQNVFGVVLALIEEWAAQDTSDHRNAFTVATCKDISKQLNGAITPFI
tara:strand:+ start:346 stop:612 length:267 start_codon:yes stop_codon:yes gene_type:complete